MVTSLVLKDKERLKFGEFSEKRKAQYHKKERKESTEGPSENNTNNI